MRKYLLVVQRHKATLGTRFVNFLIDGVIIVLLRWIFIILSLIISQLTDINFFIYFASGDFLWSIFMGMVFTFIYYFLTESYLNGRSIGKMITGTRVISTDGTKPSTKQILNRCLYRIIPFESFTFFGTDGWHDSLTDTRVINYKNYLAETQLKEEIEDIGKREIA